MFADLKAKVSELVGEAVAEVHEEMQEGAAWTEAETDKVVAAVKAKLDALLP